LADKTAALASPAAIAHWNNTFMSDLQKSSRCNSTPSSFDLNAGEDDIVPKRDHAVFQPHSARSRRVGRGAGQIKAGVGPFIERMQRERQAYVYRRTFPTRGDKAVRAQ
jgi:hypothetical protein